MTFKPKKVRQLNEIFFQNSIGLCRNVLAIEWYKAYIRLELGKKVLLSQTRKNFESIFVS